MAACPAPFRKKEGKRSLIWHTWIQNLRSKRVVCTLNLIVFIILSLHMTLLLRFHLDGHVPDTILASVPADQLAHPMDIIAQVRNRKIKFSREVDIHTPGYVHTRLATFRSKYPSENIEGSGTFDDVFVITSEKCTAQFKETERLAHEAGISITKWGFDEGRHVNLDIPSVPISESTLRKLKGLKGRDLSVMRKHILYFDAHRRLWAHVNATGKQRCLVIDDSLFPTTRLLKSLPSVLSDADQESVARQKPWHYMFLRRQIIHHESKVKKRKEPIWVMNSKYKHAVVLANVSHGASAYVLSLDGAFFLQKHVTEFREPLDIEIGLVQREFRNQFVALSACNNDVQTPFCPEMIADISHHSAKAHNCLWRRLYERWTARDFDSHFHE
ncbi:hypothetical protein FGB62_14g118 [Gracilaria domingensis]|nr:hypothetical protein FGB62_14g118 [Gracilaria domingensis]